MYVRIRKQHARQLYNDGITISMAGHKMWPSTEYCYTVSKPDIDSREDGWTFDKLVNNFSFYNCNYEEGYYPAYYIMEDVANKYKVRALAG